MKKILLLLVVLFSTYGIHYAQVIADFESPAKTPALSGTNAAVKDNPNTSGNPSNKAAYYQKEAGNWKAINLDFSSKINTGENDRLTFKIYSSTKGRVYVKLFNDANLVIESWAPEYNFQPNANAWTECTLDLTTVKNSLFNRIQVNASVDNEAVAEVYLDDFKVFNSVSPNGEPVISLQLSANEIIAGLSVSFDASASYDSDGTIVSYSWDFGDGQTGTGATINHTYTVDGIKKAVLTVEDNDGKKSKKTVFIYVLPQTGKLSKMVFFTPSPAKSEKVEAGFLVKGTYSNVYDPDEIKVDAMITLPDLSQITVPCFYYQKGYYLALSDRWAKDAGESYWMLRFSSPQSGIHKVQLMLTDQNGTSNSAEQTINIQAGSKKGIIRQDAQNRQYYRHSTGQPYTPLGINVGWGSTTDYSTIMNNLSAGGANFMRYWHAGFDRQTLEWKNGSGFYKGLGIYSQEAAAEQDSILAICKAKDMYLQMCIFHHGMFSENVNPNWVDNPYNAANGGPLTSAEQFFYNTTAKAQTKKLLRYIVARWGYSANLFAWELFNEVQFTGVHNSQSGQWRPGVLAWHDEMGQYIKSLDAFDHLVTTSDEDSQLSALDKKEGLDIVQYHLYNTNLLSVQTAKDKSLRTNLTRTGLINGEYGLDVNTANVPFDTQRIAIWTGIMNQVPHIMWLWDNYKQAEWADLFKFPAAYVQGIDFASQGTLTEWVFTAKYNSNNLNVAGFYSTSKNYYALIYDATNRNDLSGVLCDFSNLPNGVYKLTLHNTLTGATTVINNFTIYPANNKYTLPIFSKAIAIKVEYVSAITDPIAIAGEDKTIGQGKSTTLSGKTSYSPSGNPLQYTWSVTSKPANSTFAIANPNLDEFVISPDLPGDYTFNLVVKDGAKTSTADEVIITVNKSPIANAGNDQDIAEGSEIILNGSGSSDPENNPLTYNWTVVEAPLGSAKVLLNPATVNPTLKPDIAGTYKIKLVVNDGYSDSMPDTVKVTIAMVTALEPLFSKENMKLFPNPSQESITVRFTPEKTEKLYITLRDEQGKIIATIPEDVISLQEKQVIIYLNRYSLTTGLYFLEMKAGNRVISRRIVYQAIK